MKKFIIVLLIFAAYILFAHGFLGICAELLSFFDFRKNKPFDYENWEQRSRQINMKNKNILEEINKPKYDKLQKLIVENAVYYEFADGTMGIRGAWVAPDPREMPLE